MEETMENMYRLRVNTWFKTSEQGMQAMILHVDMHVISLSMFEPSMVNSWPFRELLDHESR
jgi:hypothetical protein